jgi:putative ABC transport system ATP-binding protein
MKMLIGGSV